MDCPHLLHFPRKRNQLRIGMLSNQRIGELHLGQCDGGVTILIPSGTLQITTLRKLPNDAPIKTVRTISPHESNDSIFSPILSFFQNGGSPKIV